MQVHVQKWDNRLVIPIPDSLALHANIKGGSMIDLSVVDGKFILAPVSESEYTLSQLLAEVTDQNLHSEVNTGNAVGRESW